MLSHIQPSQDRHGTFKTLQEALGVAKTAWLTRDDVYSDSIKIRIINRITHFATTTLRSCEMLSRSDPLHSCILLRPYLEFSLRGLHAAQSPDGYVKLYSYFASEHRKWMSKLSKHNPMSLSLLQQMDADAPISALPEPVHIDIRTLIGFLRDYDKNNSIPTLWDSDDFYYITVGVLHNHVHANVLEIGHENDLYISISEQIAITATCATIRIIGHEIQWEQSKITPQVCALASIESQQSAMRNLNS